MKEPETLPATPCPTCGAELLLPRPKDQREVRVPRYRCGRGWYADIAGVFDNDGGVRRCVHWQLTRELRPAS
jgi:hypothetical protein